MEYGHKKAKHFGHDATYLGAKSKALESKKGRDKTSVANILRNDKESGAGQEGKKEKRDVR